MLFSDDVTIEVILWFAGLLVIAAIGIGLLMWQDRRVTKYISDVESNVQAALRPMRGAFDDPKQSFRADRKP